MGFKREFSAGGVVYKKLEVRSSKFEVLFLLGKHSGYHKWVLPKGLIEPGEKEWQTALRETEEEAGVKARLVSEKPIHKETYFYIADFKDVNQLTNSKSEIRNSKQIPNSKFSNSKQLDNETMKPFNQLSTRRVAKYQEEGGKKTKIFKTVTFYLLEYTSGDPKKHGWEMEEAGWFEYNEALKLMAFKGEKEALEKAQKILRPNI